MTDATLSLIESVRRGDADAFLSALAYGADAKVVLPREDEEAGGCSLLGLAAFGGHNHLVSPLVAAGIPVDSAGHNTRSPLHLASALGHEKFAEALLRFGANIEAISESDDGGRPLHLACRAGHVALVELLLREGADIEAPDNFGWGPLHDASFSGHAEVVRVLIKAGANTGATAYGGWRPIHRAALWGHTQVIDPLVDGGADIEAQGPFNTRPLHYAASLGHIELMESLVRHGCDLNSVDKMRANAIHYAAGGGRLKTVQWLCEKRVPYDARNVDNRTPEDMAQLYGYHHVAWWLYKQKEIPYPPEHTQAEGSLVEYERMGKITLDWAEEGNSTFIKVQLPSRPYRIHYQDDQGWTPLHHAAYNNQMDAARAFLSSGAYPLALTYAQETPADLAQAQGHTQVAKLLQVKTPNLSRSQQMYLYESLIQTISCAELQVSALGSEKVELEHRNNLVKKVTELLTSGAPLEPVGGYTTHVLHLAITTNCTDLLPLLLCAGAPLTSSTGGMSVLQLAWFSPDVTTHIAAMVNRAITHKIKHEVTLVKGNAPEDEELRMGILSLLGLLEGKEPWQASWDGKDHDPAALTILLGRACHWGATLTASFLQREGGSVTSQTGRGHTALHAALQAGHTDTATCLVRHQGANLFLCDSHGHLPLQLCPHHTKIQLLEDALSHDYRVLDFILEKVRTDLEKQVVAHVLLLLAVLYSEANLGSSKPPEEGYSRSLENWKEVFLQLIMVLRETTSKFSDNSWLSSLVTYPTQMVSKDQGHAEVVEAEYGADREVKQGFKMEEELFFLLVEKIKQKGRSEHNRQTQTPELEDLVNSTLSRALQFCCEYGLPLLTHLLLTVGEVPVDGVIDAVSGSTGLHIAASHGRLGLVNYLLSQHASTSVLNWAGHTPAHLAYMFGHSAAGDRLYEGLEDVQDKAGNHPKDLLIAFQKYMETYMYTKKIRVKSHEQNDVLALTRAHLQEFRWKWRGNFERAVRKLHVDFTSGEAHEVKQILTDELRKILKELIKVNSFLDGNLQVLGSSADNLRLYAPDEFDCNVELKNIGGFAGGGVNVELKSLPPKEAEMKGYTTSLSVSAPDEELKNFLDGPNFVNTFFNGLFKCLMDFQLSDHRLSIVPPAIRRTQVGASISFAWEGTEFPLLLIDVDMVPVLRIPWPKNLKKPPLTPDVDVVHLSNTGDDEWRYSFASVEKMILQDLSENRRLVFLACKLLITTLKVESWAPQDVKEQYTYWNGRRFKIPAPAGFILKNTFMEEMENVKEDNLWGPSHRHERICSIFLKMCKKNTNPTTGTEYFHGKVHAYFGGDSEKPSVGLGAPEILRFLESWNTS